MVTQDMQIAIRVYHVAPTCAKIGRLTSPPSPRGAENAQSFSNSQIDFLDLDIYFCPISKITSQNPHIFCAFCALHSTTWDTMQYERVPTFL